jgi:hypothetical protein
VLGDDVLREPATFYNADFDPKKSDIGLKNTYKLIPFQKYQEDIAARS